MKYEVVPVTHFQQNCSVVWCSHSTRGAVIDPGGDIERIMESVERNGVTVDRILLTHGHLDHAGGAAQLREKLGVEIVGPHADDHFWLANMQQQAAMMGFAPLPNLQPDRWLAEGDRVTIGDMSLEVLHCPGHTPGHVVFFHRESNMAWVGDVLFAGSIGRTDFPMGDYQQLVDSIRKKLWPLGDEVRFLPGHGPMSTFGQERQSNPFVADTRFG